MHSLSFPSREEGLALHRRLLDPTDLVTSNDICERYLEPLSHWLATHSPRSHPDDCATAAEEALMSYLENPRKYDPKRLDLAAYLRMAARRDLSNLGRKEAGHRRNREPDFRVEESRLGGNSVAEQPLTILCRREEQADASRAMDAVRTECSEPERVALELLIDGERESIPYAAALGVGHLPEKEMRREVKRFKDRIEKRIERKGEANDDPTGDDGREGAA